MSDDELTLREHLLAIISANDRRYMEILEGERRAVEMALAAAKEAVAKAEAASEKRFEGVNEFRAALGDQQRTLMPRSESELRFATLDTRISDMNQGLDKRIREIGNTVTELKAARTGGREMWMLVTSIILLIISVATFVLGQAG